MGKTRRYLIFILCFVLTTIAFSFLCIGYAALQTDLSVGGTLSENTDYAVLNKAKLRHALQDARCNNATGIFIGNFDEVKESARLTENDLTFIDDVSDEDEGFGNSIGLYTCESIIYILASGSNEVKFPSRGDFDTKNAPLSADYSAHSEHPAYRKGTAYMFASYFPDQTDPANYDKGFDKIQCLAGSVTEIRFGAVDFANTETSYTPEGYDALNDQYEEKIVSYDDRVEKGETLTEPIGDDTFGEVPKYRMFFHCAALKTITFPEDKGVTGGKRTGIQKIAPAMFRGCYALETVGLPSSVTCIGSVAFGDCYMLKSITLPDALQSIGVGAFIWCSSLPNITIPNGVTAIRANTFKGNYALQSLTVPDKVTRIGARAFFNCSGLTSVKMGNGVETIEKRAFYSCWDKLTEVTLSRSLTDIGEEAFYNCSHLKQITIPGSVTEIGARAFAACGSMVSMKIENGLKTIPQEAFSGCSALADIEIGDSVTTVNTDAFKGCGIANAVIPGVVAQHINYIDFNNLDAADVNNVPQNVNSHLRSVTITSGKIANYALARCGALESITIQDGVTEIGEKAFYRCYSGNLNSLTVPGTVANIGNYAFAFCGGLKSVMIKNGVRTIGEGAFNSCWQLDTITISQTVTAMGTNAFYTGLTPFNIKYQGTEAQWNALVGNNSGWNGYTTVKSIEYGVAIP